MKLKNIVVLYCNDDFGIGGYEAFKKAFQSYGGNILWADAYQLDQTDFRSLVTKVKSLNPEGVYVIGYVKASVLLVKQLREAGYKKFLAAPMAMSIPTFIELAGGSLEGAYFTNTIFDPNSEDSIIKRFVVRFRNMFNTEPNVFSGFAYDGLFMIAEAIKNKGYEASKIKEGLREIKDYPGVMGSLSVTEDRNIKFPLRIVKLEKGKLVSVVSEVR
jgi:branched-chain amino acid transport system substrate-binding protein